MRNNKLKQITTRRQADIIAAQHVQQYKDELFEQNASEILQQVIAAVMIVHEKNDGWKDIRQKRFIENLKDYLSLMHSKDFFGREWDNDENIDYIKDRYGIDLRKEFQAETKKSNKNR